MAQSKKMARVTGYNDVAVLHLGEMEIWDGADLALLRDQVSVAARQAGLSTDRCQSLLSAVEEIAGNSLRNGGGHAELRIWTRDDALVCQVSDRVELSDPLVGARRPATREQEERGLWLANQVSDLVQLRSARQGSTTRVFAWL